MVLTGADVVGLYPALDHKVTARILREETANTEVNIDAINWRQAAKYAVLNLEPWQLKRHKISHLVPQRRHKKGTKPGISGASRIF